jgi:aspartyl-tRNA(Asn)/glutamyl-tRNA(Gln) amidotransferase subunit B
MKNQQTGIIKNQNLNMSNKKLTPTIGMETHIELRTSSKMFCSCPAEHFAKEPNTQTCPVCLGLPGALPVPNGKAVEWTIMLGLALHSRINKSSKFDRKHYFYPDLPKGFQISQYDEPLCEGGYINTSEGKINITRVHLEEDTGKLQHTEIDGKKVSLVDFNRSGVPLVEIVTEPDIHSGVQAKEYAQKLQQIVRYLGISDCDMEKGSMRLEANISWGFNFGYKVEVKNLNSFRFVAKAIDYDLKRQKDLLDKGKLPLQETRGWNEAKQKTFTQRIKETAADYRYFPEPDIPPMKFSDEKVRSIQKGIPELPDAKRVRFVKEFGISEYFINILVADKVRAEYFEEAAKLASKHNMKANTIADLMVNKNLDSKYEEPELMVKKLVELTKKDMASEKEIKNAIDEVISEQEKAVEDFKSGKTQVIGYLIGQVQRKLKGNGDPNILRKVLQEVLK